MTEDEVGAVLDEVRTSGPGWRAVPIGRRAELMHAAAGVLRRRAGELAQLVTAEMGKLDAEARAEVEKCAGTATTSRSMPRSTWLISRPLRRLLQLRAFEPLGTVLAIMPWNSRSGR